MNPTTATETHTVENVQHHSSDFSNQLASRIVANQLSGMGQKTMLKVGESRIQDEVTDSQISEILRNAGRRSRNGDEKQPCKGKDGTCRRHKHVLVENYGDAGKRETIPLSPLVAETVMKVPAQNENSPHPEQSVGQLTQDAPLQNRSLHKTLPKLPDSQQRAAHGVRSEEHHEAGILSSESKVRRRDSGISVASTTSHPEERRQQMELEKRRRERNRQREAEKREIHTKNKKKAPLRLLSLDGGGIKGYSMLLVLEELMHQCFVATHGRAPDVKNGERPFKPCEVFDMIGGTGIGGIIALLFGRLRLSVDEMKEVYPDLTSWIFERDRKLGIPIGSTMFKSSRLVEAVRHIVEQGTADQEVVDEVPSRILKSPELGSGIGYISSDSNSTGKRSMDAGYFSSDQIESTRAVSRRNKAKEILQTGNRKKRSLSDTRLRRKSSSLAAASNFRNGPDGGVSKSKLERGNPDELLYDERTARCRTFVAATLKGSLYDQEPVLLRTYNSPAEARLEPNCTIWQACAAAAAIQMHFKPVQIGQNIFLDEGPGKFNPTQHVLKEAVENTWPGRDIGCIVSIGTGRRVASNRSDAPHWWEGAIGGSVAAHAAYKRRFERKLEECGEIDKAIRQKDLKKYGTSIDDYFRFNVDMGWAAFESNEWDHLAEINTMARRYLGKEEVRVSIRESARRMAQSKKMRDAAAMLQAKPLRYSTLLESGFKAELPGSLIIESLAPVPSQYPTEKGSISPTENIILEPTKPPMMKYKQPNHNWESDSSPYANFKSTSNNTFLIIGEDSHTDTPSPLDESCHNNLNVRALGGMDVFGISTLRDISEEPEDNLTSVMEASYRDITPWAHATREVLIRDVRT